MRLLRFDKSVRDPKTGQTLDEGREYVVRRGDINHYVTLVDGFLRLEPYVLPPFAPDADWNGKKILVHRGGGAGDLLFVTPLLRAIKRRWPDCELALHCAACYHWIFESNPDVDLCHGPLMARDVLETFTGHIDLEDAIEYDPRAKQLTAVDLFGAIAGVEIADKKPFYRSPPGLADSMLARFPRRGKRVGVALRSSSLLRDYPLDLSRRMIDGLLGRGVEVALLGEPDSLVIKDPNPLLLNLTAVRPVLSWPESVAFMQSCDLIIGPDSSSIHFAGALDIPALGLYGAFPAALRVSMQPSIQAFQAHGPCSPCFHHGRRHVPFPPHGPCARTNRCEVLAGIPPEAITAQALSFLAARDVANT